jgi:hypothetical protein
MREVEFLPQWYPTALRRRAWFRAQTWATVAIVIGTGLFLLMQRRTLYAAEVDRHAASAELAETRGKVRELDQQVRLQADLLDKQNLVAQLGVPVELSRVLAEVGECMPAEMTLDEVNVSTVEADRSIVEQQRSRPGKREVAREPIAKSRKLRVQITGVAPSDSQVYGFFGQLTDRRFLDNVRLDRTSERRTESCVMREFAVSFEVPLDYVVAPSGVAGVRE